MFGEGQLARCAERKTALLQQSARHRDALIAEAQQLRPVAAWMDLGLDLARKARTGCTALAPLLSLWQTRKQEKSGFMQKLTGGISLARSLAALWKGLH